ncbi:MAG: transposase DNA-binding-containing protein [Chitinophagales bacterium]
MHKITVKDFPTLDLGNERRDEKFIKIIENIVRHPGGSIPQHSEQWYDTKATYEFFFIFIHYSCSLKRNAVIPFPPANAA